MTGKSRLDRLAFAEFDLKEWWPKFVWLDSMSPLAGFLVILESFPRCMRGLDVASLRDSRNQKICSLPKEVP